MCRCEKLFVYCIAGLSVAIACFASDATGIHGEIRCLLLSASETNEPQELLSQYARVTSISIDVLVVTTEDILNEILSGDTPDPEGRYIANSAVYLLGRIGRENSLRVLKKGLSDKHGYLHTNIIRAYVKIASTDKAVSLAQDIVDNQDAYDFMVRFILYESLHRRVTESEIIPSESERAQLGAFLIDAARVETRGDVAMRLDETLMSVLPQYRFSHQREQLAERFMATGVEVYDTYFQAALQTVRSAADGGQPLNNK